MDHNAESIIEKAASLCDAIINPGPDKRAIVTLALELEELISIRRQAEYLSTQPGIKVNYNPHTGEPEGCTIDRELSPEEENIRDLEFRERSESKERLNWAEIENKIYMDMYHENLQRSIFDAHGIRRPRG